MAQYSPMRRILPFILFAASLSQGQELPKTQEALDKQFREKLLVFYQSPEFTKTAAWDVNLQIAEIARSVYASQPDILRESAKKSFLALPEIKQADIPSAENPVVLPVADLMKAEPEKAGEAMKAFLESKKGAFIFLNNRDVLTVSASAIQMVMRQVENEEHTHKRAILAAYVRDVFHRLNADFLHPKIAVQSLGEWFIVDLEWQEAGFYFPNRIEWRRRS